MVSTLYKIKSPEDIQSLFQQKKIPSAISIMYNIKNLQNGGQEMADFDLEMLYPGHLSVVKLLF